jgi:putative DNA primase/helicase
VNFAKLAYACNTIPKTSEDTDAFWRRWMLITFPNKFEKETDNRNLLSELTTPEELSGVLNWMIEGLKRLRDNNWKFSYNKGAEEVRTEYIRKSSPIQAFVMDCTDPEPLIEVAKRTLYNAFLDYARKHNLGLMQYETFCRNLPPAAKVEDCKPTIAGHRIPSFRGLFLREAKDWGKKKEGEDDNQELSRKNGGHGGQAGL